MRNLVRRLRDPAFGTETSERNLMNQAADRIAQLEAALRGVLDAEWTADLTAKKEARAAARAALEASDDK